MNRSRSKAEPIDTNTKLGTVRLSVAGQIIDVSWEDLLEPSKWFSAGASANPTQK